MPLLVSLEEASQKKARQLRQLLPFPRHIQVSCHRHVHAQTVCRKAVQRRFLPNVEPTEDR